MTKVGINYTHDIVKFHKRKDLDLSVERRYIQYQNVQSHEAMFFFLLCFIIQGQK